MHHSRPATNYAIAAFHEIERGGGAEGIIPPVARLGVAISFLVALVSFGKYEFAAIASLAVYPASLALFEGVPIAAGFARFKLALVPVILVGAVNPFLDREVVASIGPLAISGGWLSLATLALKGLLALSVTWALLRRTGMDGMAEAFASLRLPPSFGLSIRLTHRYLVLIVKELERMKDAYALRSGGAGAAIRPSSWGPFAGLLMMRSMDRAAAVRAAVELRGGEGGLRRVRRESPPPRRVLAGLSYFCGWTAYFVAASILRPMESVGDFVMGLFS